MDEEKGITRRQALKKMGAAAVAGAALGIGGLQAAELFSGKKFNGKKMKVLLVNGSPHKEGCTFTALSEVASALSADGIETEIFWIGRQALSGCIGCGACSQNGRCFMNDTVNDFLEKAADFDGFVFGSPVHFAAMNGAMTSFMNRAFFCARSGDTPLRGKPAAMVASSRRAGSISTLDQLSRYFVHGGMPVVPSQYWPMVYGNTPGEVRQDAEGLQIMRTLGHNMRWMLCCFEAGRQMQIDYPERETRLQTNFIR